MVSAAIGNELANIVFYGICALPTIFCLIASGLFGIGCWLNALILVSVRLSGYALIYKTATTTGGLNYIGIVLNGIGISPLTLAVGGMLGNSNVSIRPKLHPLLRGWGTLISSLLVIVGNTVELSGLKENTRFVIGAWLIFAGWVWICGMCLGNWISKENLNRRPEELQMLVASSLALPFVGVRIIYLLVLIHRESEMALIEGGGVTLDIVLASIPEFLCMVSLLTAGLATWKLGSIRKAERKAAKEDNEAQELVPKGDNESVVSF